MSDVGHAAMILAAGFGKRMQPLTLTRPKPLVEVSGKKLIDYAIDKLKAAHVQRAVVNAHYIASQIEAWARSVSGLDIAVSLETDEILDTGGGIARALPLLGRDPFFVLNSDSFWIDAGVPALDRLRQAWNDQRMDCLLLLCRPSDTIGYDGKGDFFVDADGRLRRASGSRSDAFVYIGGYLVHPRIFAEAPDGPFSMNVIWDRLIDQGRLFGVIHSGTWLHVGTPDAIGLAEEALSISVAT
jgi:MurNAc alpha-1-phosphate uridylyltransferase